MGGGCIASLLIAQFLLYLFPQNIEVAEAISEFMLGDNSFIVALIAFAILPAICEEVLFRGFLITAFKGKKSAFRPVILSSILFGIMHIDFIRMIPTAILGLTLGYAVYNTSSIFIPMLMHFMNNGLVIFASYYPENIISKLYSYSEIDFSNLNVAHLILLVVMSIVLISVGILLIKKPKNKKNVPADV